MSGNEAPVAKRATRNSSALFRNVLTQAEKRLALNFEEAANFEHHGIRGDERANPLIEFLSDHLPNVFAVGKGEARDYLDNVTGQLDLIVFDRSTAAPIQTSSDNLIVPAEAMYAVIEVKSVLSQAEIDTCLQAAKKVRSLRPFKKQFIAPPTDGAIAPNHFRCPYFIFAYSSNLGSDKWAESEYQRLLASAKKAGWTTDLIDRLIVMDRGIIQPQGEVALSKLNSPSLFLEFYLHLVNFLAREIKRRPPIDWMAYTSSSRWTKINVRGPSGSGGR
jgi:hypothetical protein